MCSDCGVWEENAKAALSWPQPQGEKRKIRQKKTKTYITSVQITENINFHKKKNNKYHLQLSSPGFLRWGASCPGWGQDTPGYLAPGGGGGGKVPVGGGGGKINYYTGSYFINIVFFPLKTGSHIPISLKFSQRTTKPTIIYICNQQRLRSGYTSTQYGKGLFIDSLETLEGTCDQRRL